MTWVEVEEEGVIKKLKTIVIGRKKRQCLLLREAYPGACSTALQSGLAPVQSFIRNRNQPSTEAPTLYSSEASVTFYSIIASYQYSQWRSLGNSRTSSHRVSAVKRRIEEVNVRY